VQRFLLRIGFALITFAISSVAVKVGRNPRSPVSPGPAEAPASSVTATEPVFRCDKKPVLPFSIKALLDKRFPGWQFPEISDEDCRIVKQWGGPDAHPELIQGDFDGDGEVDYAILIQHGSITDDHGVVLGPGMWIVAFLHKHDRYQMRVVTKEGGSCSLIGMTP